MGTISDNIKRFTSRLSQSGQAERTNQVAERLSDVSKHAFTVDLSRQKSPAKYQCKFFKINQCGISTGVAACQEATGDPPNLTVDPASDTVYVYIGDNSWVQKDDFIVAHTFPNGVNLQYVATAFIHGPKRWKPPTGPELASIQDTPDVDTYCGDGTTAPAL